MQKKDKILRIDELAQLLPSIREKNKSIVQCHGVFDLLHIGHIRHFEQARKFGDILVVTLTADRFVNKGPNRPVFSENLRAEAIASLSFVDFVSIVEFPTAVEAIQYLHPNYYVKGSEYQDSRNDLTSEIINEEKAVQSAGGELVFTDDITFSSSNLLNRHLSVFSSEVNKYLINFSEKFKLKNILDYLEGAEQLKVLVIGETIIDEYQYCKAIGKSSKEPTLVLKADKSEKFAGGIVAVANHVSNFSYDVGLVTFLGSINDQRTFINEKLNNNIKQFIFNKKDSPTIVKRRFVESYFFTKMLEVYEINDTNLDKGDDEKLCSILNVQIPKYDLVLVVDFGHGMLSQKAIDIICQKAQYLALNVQANAGNLGFHTVSNYSRADFISISENEIRLEERDRYGDLYEMMHSVSEKLHCSRIIVTRGKNGCICFDKHDGFFEIPTFAYKIVDRVGAGDAFFSVSSLLAVQNAPMEMIGFVGNAVGAQAVATVCNRQPVEKTSLKKQIETLLK